MDFQVAIDDQTFTFDQFHDVMFQIEQSLAQWNNFHPDEPLQISIWKIPSDGDVLELKVEEVNNVRDLFGGA